MTTEPPEKSELRISASQNERGFLKNLILNVRGPAGVIIIALWMCAVVSVAIFAKGIAQAAAFGLLAYFIAAYFTVLGRQ